MSDNDKKKVLVLVEGAKTDSIVMERLFSIYQIDAEYKLVSYCTNIYTLFHEMFQEGEGELEYMDLLQVLKAREKDVDKKKIFDEKYTDILLIFDLDPQDPRFNAEHIQMMQDFFSESSDMGKLYLNYPMVESFYHLRSIPDNEYFERKVYLKELTDKTYKTRVNKETIGGDYRKFIRDKNECSIVILQNLSKAIFICTGRNIEWKDILSSFNAPNLCAVLERQLMCLKNEGFIYVLCTCALYISDYNPKLLLPETI